MSFIFVLTVLVACLLQVGFNPSRSIRSNLGLILPLIKVAILLVSAEGMVNLLWRFNLDPDDHALPYLTALGDVVGTGLLVAGFYFLVMVGDQEIDTGLPSSNSTNPDPSLSLRHFPVFP